MTLDGCVSSNDIAELYEDAQLVLLLTPPDHKEKEKERGKEKERERERQREKEKERGKEREKEREKDFKYSDRTSKVKSPRSSLQSSGKQSYAAAYTDIEKINPPPLFVCHKSDSTRNPNLTDSGVFLYYRHILRGCYLPLLCVYIMCQVDYARHIRLNFK